MAIPCNVQPGFSFTAYPCAIDSSNQLPITVDGQTPVKAEVVNRQREAILAIESELGINPSGVYTTVRARLDALEALIGSGGGGGIQTILEEGVVIESAATSLDFVGTGITATSDGLGNVTITSELGASSQVQETIAVTVLDQTAFTLSDTPADSTAVEMFVNGIKQQYGSDYTVSGTSVSYLSSAYYSLTVLDVVEFWYLVSGIILPGGTGSITVQDEGVDIDTDTSFLNFTGAGVAATSGGAGIVNVTIDGTGALGLEQETIPVTINGQQAFVISEIPVSDGYVQMFINGLKQENDVDYTQVGTSVTYNDTDLVIADIVEFYYHTFTVATAPPGGIQTLADTLTLGNVTGGRDIVLSAGDEIINSLGNPLIISTLDNGAGNSDNITLRVGSATGTRGQISLDGDASVIGDLSITGKLTVDGLIDPTGLVLSEQATAPYSPAGAGGTEGLLWVHSDGYLIFTNQNDVDLVVGGGGIENVNATAGGLTSVETITSDLTGNTITIDLPSIKLDTAANANTIIGQGTPPLAGIGDNNTIIGDSSGSSTTGRNNSVVGHFAMSGTGVVHHNVVIGDGAATAESMVESVVVGQSAASAMSGGSSVSNSVIIGRRALGSNTRGYRGTVIIGQGALFADNGLSAGLGGVYVGESVAAAGAKKKSNEDVLIGWSSAPQWGNFVSGSSIVKGGVIAIGRRAATSVTGDFYAGLIAIGTLSASNSSRGSTIAIGNNTTVANFGGGPLDSQILIGQSLTGVAGANNISIGTPGIYNSSSDDIDNLVSVQNAFVSREGAVMFGVSDGSILTAAALQTSQFNGGSDNQIPLGTYRDADTKALFRLDTTEDTLNGAEIQIFSGNRNPNSGGVTADTIGVSGAFSVSNGLRSVTDFTTSGSGTDGGGTLMATMSSGSVTAVTGGAGFYPADTITILEVDSTAGTSASTTVDTVNSPTATRGSIYYQGGTNNAIWHNTGGSDWSAISGIIDPTGMVFVNQNTVPGGIPAAGESTLWVRDSDGYAILTDEFGTDSVLGSGGGGGGGSGSLSDTLNNGNTTDSYDIELTAGDSIIIDSIGDNPGTGIRALPGKDLSFSVDDASSGDGGDIYIKSGGSGTSGSDYGGYIYLLASDGDFGGSVHLIGGNGNVEDGGDVHVVAGEGVDDGGNIRIASGSGVDVDGNIKFYIGADDGYYPTGTERFRLDTDRAEFYYDLDIDGNISADNIITIPTLNDDGYIPIAEGGDLIYSNTFKREFGVGVSNTVVMTSTGSGSLSTGYRIVGDAGESIALFYEDVTSKAILSASDTDLHVETNGFDLVLDSGAPLVWPASDGDDGYVLSTDGAGNLKFRILPSAFLSNPEVMTITSTTQTTQLTGFSVLSAFEFDPADFPSSSSILFKVILETSNSSDNAEIRLYNVSTASVVTASTISTTSITAASLSGDISGNMTAGSNIYEVQLRLQSTVSGTPTAACKRAELRIS